jgi:hypothetical protein
MRAVAASVALAAIVVGCNDSGGAARRVDPHEGIWQGTMVAPGSGATTGVTLIVEPGGAAHLVPIDVTGEPLDGIELWGRLFAEAGAVSGSLDHFESGGSVTLEVTGTVVMRSSLEFDLHDADQPGSLFDGFHVATQFDPTWDRDSSLARVAGAWTIGDVALAVALNGSLEGDDPSGGRYYGTLVPEVQDVDLYSIVIEAYFAGAGEPWFYSGVAILLDRGGPDGALLFTMQGSQYGWFGDYGYWSGLMTR